MWRRLFVMTTVGSLFLVLAACGQSGDSPDAITSADPDPIDPETAVTDERTSGGKADRLAKCEPESFGYDAGSTASVAGELGGDCPTRHYIPVFDIDRPVEFDMRGTARVVDSDGTSHSSLVGICLLRWQFTRSFGGSDQPSEFVEDGWSMDQLAHEGETPCGHFAPTADGGFEPVEGTKPFEGSTLKPGRYRLMIQAPSGTLEDGQTFEYDLQFDIRDLGGPVCGDGEVEDHSLWTEQCDRGDQSPFDACSAGCRWQRALAVDPEVSEPNDEAREAFDLEGFRRLDWRGWLRPDGDDPEDWFRLQVGDGDVLSIGENPHRSRDALGETVLLNLYRNGDDFSRPVATDFGSRTFENLEAGEYLLRVRPSDSAAPSDRLDYAFRISPTPR